GERGERGLGRKALLHEGREIGKRIAGGGESGGRETEADALLEEQAGAIDLLAAQALALLREAGGDGLGGLLLLRLLGEIEAEDDGRAVRLQGAAELPGFLAAGDLDLDPELVGQRQRAQDVA